MRRSLLGILLLTPGLVGAQRTRTISLPAADGRFEQPFSSVVAIRELSDGRIIVADRIDLGLVVADFRTQATKPISRRGGGPGEYGMVARLYALAGDSTLMPDLTQRRWLLLDGDRVVATVPPDNPTVRLTQSLFTAVDGAGHVMRESYDEAPVGESTSGDRDSSYVVRFHRTTGRVDTIARLMRRPMQVMRQSNAKGETTMMSARALRLRVGEQFLPYRDGWLAVVRVNPFRVDWRSPDGRWTKDAPLPVPVIRLTDREKQASLARTARSQAANPSSVQLPPSMQLPDDDWPTVMPPYIQGELLPSPEGHVIIRRQPTADSPGVAYYVVDRRGRLSGIIELKDNERLFASGARAIYVVESDADDLKYIRRHPWPHSALPPG